MWKTHQGAFHAVNLEAAAERFWGRAKMKPWEFPGAVRRRFLTSLIGRRKHQSKMENGIQQLFINYSLKIFPNHAYFYVRCQSLKHVSFPMQIYDMYDTKQSIKPHSISMGQTGSKPVFPFGISLNSIYITHLFALFAV